MPFLWAVLIIMPLIHPLYISISTDEPTKNGKNFKRGPAGLSQSRSRPMSPVRHGRHGMMSRDADDEEGGESPRNPTNSFLTSDNDMAVGSREFDKMVATDNFTPTKFKSKDEKNAAKRLVKEKQRLEKAHMEQEHRKKMQVEALLKAEVKQKRQFSAKMKREQKRLDERQKIQARALNQAKEEQEKYLSDLERQHQRLVKEKMKVRRLTSLQLGFLVALHLCHIPTYICTYMFVHFHVPLTNIHLLSLNLTYTPGN